MVTIPSVVFEEKDFEKRIVFFKGIENHTKSQEFRGESKARDIPASPEFFSIGIGCTQRWLQYNQWLSRKQHNLEKKHSSVIQKSKNLV